MRRTLMRLVCAAAGLSLACSETATAPSPAAGEASRFEYDVLPLPMAIDSVSWALFPKGLETASGTRWRSVKEKLDQGQTAVAHTMFNELLAWIELKAPQLEALENETAAHAAARLSLYMATYIYGGGATADVPAVGGDVAFGLVLPTTAETVVTPGGTAGVHLPAGAVSVPTLVVVSENPDPYAARCSGPLDTTLCQYPLFYHFNAFPAVKLQTPGRFGVCHVTTGTRQPSEVAHARVRVAHDLPDDPANYTAGALQYQGVEILELVDVTDFLHCGDVGYPPSDGAGELGLGESSLLDDAWGSLASATRAVLRTFVPTPAHAAMMRIDQGLGGRSEFWSSFGVVEPPILTGAETHHETWTSDGMWHPQLLPGPVNTLVPTYVDLAPGDASAGALPGAFAGSRSWWFGSAATGSFIGVQAASDVAGSGGISESSYSGTLASPLFTVPADRVTTLIFRSWFEIESFDAHHYDLMLVFFQPDGGDPIEIARMNPPGDVDGGPATPFTSGGFNLPPVWTEESVDLTGYAGQTGRIYFHFSTLDQSYNGFRGWIVDDVVVASVLPPVVTSSPSLRAASPLHLSPSLSSVSTLPFNPPITVHPRQ